MSNCGIMYQTMDASLKELARAYYESHRLSFADLSKASENVLGQSVTVDQLKKWSQEDAGWKKKSLTGDDKTAFIADLIFNKIEEEQDELSARDLTSLANAYLAFATKAPEDIAAKEKPTMQMIMDAVQDVDR